MANRLNDYLDQAKKRKAREPGNRESGESGESGTNAESMHFYTLPQICYTRVKQIVKQGTQTRQTRQTRSTQTRQTRLQSSIFTRFPGVQLRKVLIVNAIV
jgi:hypothetical protein